MSEGNAILHVSYLPQRKLFPGVNSGKLVVTIEIFLQYSNSF